MRIKHFFFLFSSDRLFLFSAGGTAAPDSKAERGAAAAESPNSSGHRRRHRRRAGFPDGASSAAEDPRVPLPPRHVPAAGKTKQSSSSTPSLCLYLHFAFSDTHLLFSGFPGQPLLLVLQNTVSSYLDASGVFSWLCTVNHNF